MPKNHFDALGGYSNNTLLKGNTMNFNVSAATDLIDSFNSSNGGGSVGISSVDISSLALPNTKTQENNVVLVDPTTLQPTNTANTDAVPVGFWNQPADPTSQNTVTAAAPATDPLADVKKAEEVVKVVSGFAGALGNLIAVFNGGRPNTSSVGNFTSDPGYISRINDKIAEQNSRKSVN
jgi:hypothetical protein